MDDFLVNRYVLRDVNGLSNWHLLYPLVGLGHEFSDCFNFIEVSDFFFYGHLLSEFFGIIDYLFDWHFLLNCLLNVVYYFPPDFDVLGTVYSALWGWLSLQGLDQILLDLACAWGTRRTVPPGGVVLDGRLVEYVTLLGSLC